MKKLVLILVLAALGLLFMLVRQTKASSLDRFWSSQSKLSSDNSNNEREVKKEFEVKPGGKLTIDLKTGAAIDIKGWDKSLLSATAVISEEDEDNPMEFSFEKNGNSVEITSKFKYEKRSNHSNAKLIVYLPQKYNVEFNTMGGAVIIGNVDGNTEGKTMGGAIVLSELKGYVNTETMGGAISLIDSEVDGRVKTMGGPVNLKNVKGDVDATTMGGPIIQSNVQGKDKSGKGVSISTMGGPIVVDEALNGANVKTMGGNIDIKKAAKHVYAETMGGKISIGEIDGSVEASTMGGDIDVKMTGALKAGDKNVSLSSKGGDVTLTVPDGLPMDVDIQITVKDEDRYDKYKIVSDFQLKEDHSSGEWKESHHNRGKHINGTGTINGGGNKIKIRTINGNVYLKKS